MLENLITSKTRMKLLLKFFSNTKTRAYLRGLAEEFGESTNSIRVELNRLSNAGLLSHEQNGKTILYSANPQNPFFKALQKIVMKYMGLDDVIENVVRKIGDLEFAYITGDYSRGVDSGVIELVLVAQKLDMDFLAKLHRRAEELSQRKVDIKTLNLKEFEALGNFFETQGPLIIYANPDSGFKNSIDI